MGFKNPCATSVKEYLDITLKWTDNLKEKKDLFVLYRGHRKMSHKLVPTIARPSKISNEYSPKELEQIEKGIFEEFQRLCNHHITVDFHVDKTDKLEILSLAQHYDLPTRLLDWTSNPLAALYFAVQNIEENDESSFSVWAYCIKNENKNLLPQGDPRRQDPFGQQETLIFKPKIVTDRIHVQAGWFTLHACNNLNGYDDLFEIESWKQDLARIDFPREKAEEIRKHLDTLHINSSTLFPDITGKSKHIRWKVLKEYDHSKSLID